MSRFAGKAGLHQSFYDLYKVTHLAVEAPIESVTPALAQSTAHFRDTRTLVAVTGIYGKPAELSGNWLIVFQLQGQGWTQVFASIQEVDGLRLAKHLSSALDTRCLCVEVTDDAYNTHALFERGNAQELALDCTVYDVRNILERLELPIPPEYDDPKDEDDDFEDEHDDATYFHSTLAPSDEVRQLSSLAEQLGVYLHTPYFEQGKTMRLLEVAQDDVMRMDLLRNAG